MEREREEGDNGGMERAKIKSPVKSSMETQYSK